MIDEEYLADIRGAAGFDGATFNAKAVRFLLRLLDEARAEADFVRRLMAADMTKVVAERDAERQRADRLAETLESVRDCKKDRCKQCQVLIHHALAHPGKGEPQG